MAGKKVVVSNRLGKVVRVRSKGVQIRRKGIFFELKINGEKIVIHQDISVLLEQLDNPTLSAQIADAFTAERPTVGYLKKVFPKFTITYE